MNNPIAIVHSVRLNAFLLLLLYAGELNSERMPNYNRLDVRLERKYHEAWGDWSWYVDLINLLGCSNTEGYIYAPNGVDIERSPPDGFNRDVPVLEDNGIDFFPSVGEEISF